MITPCPACAPTLKPAGTDAGSSARARSTRRFAGGAARLIVPGVAMAFIPKCPLCLAGYIALATGIGIGAPAAAALRTSLVILCGALIALAAAQALICIARPLIAR